MNISDKRKILDEIAREIETTGGGPLAAPGVYPVPGEGNPGAEIMFIGEAPGFHENEQKRPFVGQAGKLLRQSLVENSWQEDEVYITNIIKYRPPENRDPTSEEIEFFRPLLDKQIKTIDPKIIVTLGRYSMYKFLGEGASISRIHGIPRTVNWGGKSVTIFPMYHPAAALRAGDVMNMFREDFKKLRDFMDKEAANIPIAETTNINQKIEPQLEQLKLV